MEIQDFHIKSESQLNGLISGRVFLPANPHHRRSTYMYRIIRPTGRTIQGDVAQFPPRVLSCQQLYQDMLESLWSHSTEFLEHTGFNATVTIEGLQETERLQEISRAKVNELITREMKLIHAFIGRKLAGFYKALQESFGHYLQGTGSM
ncbi:hypothetical protein HDU67_003293 [Dinochytrium kinnereticum]|nr:hypothetical protein HDU67_003293 [Dinochytrium kinnereticum]